jgi:hypothetical protein
MILKISLDVQARGLGLLLKEVNRFRMVVEFEDESAQSYCYFDLICKIVLFIFKEHWWKHDEQN